MQMNIKQRVYSCRKLWGVGVGGQMEEQRGQDEQWWGVLVCRFLGQRRGGRSRTR